MSPVGWQGSSRRDTCPRPCAHDSMKRLDGGMTGVTMTPELALAASTIELSTENLLEDRGVVMQLPLKMKLSNPFLGDDCYIGSAADPIVRELHRGGHQIRRPRTSRSAASRVPSNSWTGLRCLVDHGVSLVDNAFAVPRATGCGGSFAATRGPRHQRRARPALPRGTQHRNPQRQHKDRRRERRTRERISSWLLRADREVDSGSGHGVLDSRGEAMYPVPGSARSAARRISLRAR